MSADKKNTGMKQNQNITQRGELKPPIGKCQSSQREQCRKDFQRPGEIIVGTNGGPRQDNRESAEQE
ncbi:MAG TPA: hypothetical protein VH724_07615 [Candidatus Angelobacter sp.]|nr:hypothetical protein [Candidatus Angelobacter sp.]